MNETRFTLNHLDHLVLTVADIASTIAFYENVLGMTAEEFRPADGSTRWALKFGQQKINLHQQGQEFVPKARCSTSGSADLCFLSDVSVKDWQDWLLQNGVKTIEGPIKRTGAAGPILSIYLRDPDDNLIEIANRIS